MDREASEGCVGSGCRHECDGWCGGVFAVDPSGGRGPFQDSARKLSDPPGGELFHAVVPLAQMGEVPQGGGPAFGGVDRMVDLAPDRGASASREPAVLVAGPQEAALRPGGAVAVDGEDGPVDRFGQYPRPGGGVRCQAPRGVGVDRGTSHEVGGPVVATEKGEGGDDDLNLRACLLYTS